MILFVSGATATVRKYRRCGELIVPGAGNAPDSLRLNHGWWAMENGQYSRDLTHPFDCGLFMDMLKAFHGRKGCRFVTAPDVVADAHLTLKNWPFWSGVIRGAGFVPALVAQDGMTIPDLPWREIGALFVGGTTEWKLGPQAASLMAYAKSRGLWVHAGRVNSDERIWDLARKGADSYDGSKHSWFPDTYIGKSIQVGDAAVAQGRLC